MFAEALAHPSALEVSRTLAEFSRRATEMRPFNRADGPVEKQILSFIAKMSKTISSCQPWSSYSSTDFTKSLEAFHRIMFSRLPLQILYPRDIDDLEALDNTFFMKLEAIANFSSGLETWWGDFSKPKANFLPQVKAAACKEIQLMSKQYTPAGKANCIVRAAQFLASVDAGPHIEVPDLRVISLFATVLLTGPAITGLLIQLAFLRRFRTALQGHPSVTAICNLDAAVYLLLFFIILQTERLKCFHFKCYQPAFT